MMERLLILFISLNNECCFIADAQSHGTTKLISYFAVLTFCLISKTEKLMVSV